MVSLATLVTLAEAATLAAEAVVPTPSPQAAADGDGGDLSDVGHVGVKEAEARVEDVDEHAPCLPGLGARRVAHARLGRLDVPAPPPPPPPPQWCEVVRVIGSGANSSSGGLFACQVLPQSAYHSQRNWAVVGGFVCVPVSSPVGVPFTEELGSGGGSLGCWALYQSAYSSQRNW